MELDRFLSDPWCTCAGGLSLWYMLSCESVCCLLLLVSILFVSTVEERYNVLGLS